MLTHVSWVPKRGSGGEILGLQGDSFIQGGGRNNADEDERRMHDIAGGLHELRLDEIHSYVKQNEQNGELDDYLDVEPTDSLIVCIDENNLQIYLLERSGGGKVLAHFHRSLVFRKLLLSATWLDCALQGYGSGNLIAIGSHRPAIEIWDLDNVYAVEPSCVLSGHTDSVSDIARNKEFMNIIASASHDNLVKIWDVAVGKCNNTLELHEEPVTAVAWNHQAPQVLLSGCTDGSVAMSDGRMPSHSGYKWSIAADVDSLAWNPHSEYCFVVSGFDNLVTGFDTRAAASSSGTDTRSSFTIRAHDEFVGAISYNSLVPNLLATGSDDELKLWDLTNDQPLCLVSQSLQEGGARSVSFSESYPFTLAIGGYYGSLELWDTLSEAVISQRYGSYLSSKFGNPAS